MKNRMTFNKKYRREQRERITAVLERLRADIMHNDRTLPDVRVVGPNGIRCGYDIVPETDEEWSAVSEVVFDGTVRYPDSRTLMHVSLQEGSRQRTDYTFEVHDRSKARILPNGDYVLDEAVEELIGGEDE